MKLTLTERDKKILKIVACAAILVLAFQFLLGPAWERKQALEAEVEATALQKQEWMLDIDRLDALHAEVYEQEYAIKSAYTHYYSEIETETMDRVVTNLALRHGLFPVSLSLAPARAEGVAPFGVEEAPQVNFIRIAEMSFVLQGTTQQWMEMIDDINLHYPGLRVLSFTTSDIDYLQENGHAVSTTEINCTLQILMFSDEPAHQNEAAEQKAEEDTVDEDLLEAQEGM